MSQMLKLKVKLENKKMDLESQLRCEDMRIYGVPDEAENDSTTMVSFAEKPL